MNDDEIAENKPKWCNRDDCLRKKAYYYIPPYYYVNSYCSQCKYFIRDADNLKTQEMMDASLRTKVPKM